MEENPESHETPELTEPVETPETKPPRHWSFWLWVGAAALLVFNVGLLFFSGASTEEVQADEHLEDELASFDQLSFWQRLLAQDEDESLVSVPSKFDGQEVDAEFEESALHVMIDNFSLARPQHSGIRSASVVYEALVEGGITRLMLVFPYQEIERVGPVRSARDYFVDFAEEFGGLYVHAGGSPAALDRLYSSPALVDVDEDEAEEDEPYSFRDGAFEAPHNLFFDLLSLREWSAAADLDRPIRHPGFCFTEAEELTGSPVEQLNLNFSNDRTTSYFVQFRFDTEDRVYRRYYYANGPEPHVDANDQLQVSPKNIIVQISPSYLIDGDEKERLTMDHLGEGVAYFYRDGKRVSGSWKKPTKSSVTRYYDENGEEICLLPGQTWVAIVDTEDLLEEFSERIPL